MSKLPPSAPSFTAVISRVARSSGTSSKTSGTIVSTFGWGGKTREVRGGGDEGKLRLTVFYGTQTGTSERYAREVTAHAEATAHALPFSPKS